MKDSATTPEPQEDVDWTNISIAVPADMKREFEALADRMRLKPSQYGRMLLADAIARAKLTVPV